MQKQETDIKDVFLLEPKVFGDARGWFMEPWSEQTFAALSLSYHFVQDNESYSTSKGTLRGLHFQSGTHVQAKLVRCDMGAILDVVVDLRKSSPTYLKWIAVELSEENKRQLMIPRGCAHGFLTLTEQVKFLYKVDNFYCPESERVLRWNDPTLAIDWGNPEPILNQRDAQAPLLFELEHFE